MNFQARNTAPGGVRAAGLDRGAVALTITEDGSGGSVGGRWGEGARGVWWGVGAPKVRAAEVAAYMRLFAVSRLKQCSGMAARTWAFVGSSGMAYRRDERRPSGKKTVPSGTTAGLTVALRLQIPSIGTSVTCRQEWGPLRGGAGEAREIRFAWRKDY